MFWVPKSESFGAATPPQRPASVCQNRSRGSEATPAGGEGTRGRGPRGLLGARPARHGTARAPGCRAPTEPSGSAPADCSGGRAGAGRGRARLRRQLAAAAEKRKPAAAGRDGSPAQAARRAPIASGPAAPPASAATWRRRLLGGRAATPPAPRPPPPGRRAGASSRRRPRPPSSRARPPALLGPGPLLPSRLLTALRRIPLGDCAAILRGESELQSQARPRPQPDWEARRPPRGSRSRPLPGRAAPRGAPPAHFRLGPGRIGRVGGRRAGLGGGWLCARAPHPHTVRRQAHACGQRAQTAASWTCRLKVGAKDDVCGEAR